MSRARFLLLGLLVTPVIAGCDNGPLPTAATDTTTTTGTTVAASPVTETFSGQLAKGGYAFRSFNAAKAGTATVTLTSVSVSSTLKVGFGLGIPDTTGSNCLFTRSSETAAGGQLTATVDAGVYCVKLWDLGTLTASTNFVVTIIRP